MHHAITASTLLLMTLTVPLASKAESTSSDSLRWQPLPPLPDPHGFACPVVGTLDDCPVVAGGSNFPNAPLWEKGVKVWHDQVFLSDPKASAWHVVGRLPRAIVYAVSVSVDNAIFIVGGQDGENVSSEVLRLRLLEGKLEFDTPLPPLPEPLSMAAGCLVDRVIYLAGGVNSVENPEPTRAFYSLDLDAEKPVWNQLAPWPGPPRCLAAVGARNGELILVGGLSRMKDIQADDYLLDAYAFNPVTGWSVLPTLLQPAAAAASPMPTTPDGTLMLIGGSDGSQSGFDARDYPQVSRRVQLLGPHSDTWSLGRDAPMARVGVNTVPWRGGWLLPTGEVSPGVRSPEVWLLELGQP